MNINVRVSDAHRIEVVANGCPVRDRRHDRQPGLPNRL